MLNECKACGKKVLAIGSLGGRMMYTACDCEDIDPHGRVKVVED